MAVHAPILATLHIRRRSVSFRRLRARDPVALLSTLSPSGGEGEGPDYEAGGFRPRALKVGTGLRKPFNVSFPTSSSSISPSTAPATREATRIWSPLASPQRRAARLVTVPIAP